MLRIGIACDCHNTLVYSNEAWVRAFTDYLGASRKEVIEYCLYAKSRRRDLAKKYDIDFSDLEQRVHHYVEGNKPLLLLLDHYKQNGTPLFVVSNAPYQRVMGDLCATGIDEMFDRVYSKEDGGKKNNKIFDEIIDQYALDMILFIGNEEFDDHINHPKVISVALTSYLLKRHEVLSQRSPFTMQP